ncbi:TRAP-type C4-dicarboxylate transport system, small permease component [Ruegeria denitrificans]|uniref:TRAP transporter small permease protein n=1 Tax=Ruegeria denitrificans TaxID=1715692 RepID=A0A0P1I8C6_9RHOB|nr:TRAP transporter small permease [Ruegeria denitrificans]CUJ97025.1 TRAP-type C4-dicarboxylate transport system, small permease component [Ruegeria denitrificans]
MTKLEFIARYLITSWALIGGFVLIGVVLVNAWSILAGAIINKPFPGDFELTEMGAAIAAFCFLPYCQLVGANVSADIFTMKAGPTSVALMSILAAIVALLFAALLIWRMSVGLQDYREYEEFTGILGIPIWWAFVPVLISLVLLFSASLITLTEAVGTFRKSRA